MDKFKNYRQNLTDPESASLFVFEFANLPWQPQRIYLIQDFVKGTTRGNHAHKTLSQILLVISGNIHLNVYRGAECHKYDLSRLSGEIELLPGDWRVISNASPDAIVMVLADAPFDESDYIRNWEEYLNWFYEDKR